NQPLRQAFAVAAGSRKYPLFSDQGASACTTSSPTSPGSTSQSFSSTNLTFAPLRGVPQIPDLSGLGPETSCVEISDILKSVHTVTPKRSENAFASSASGTTITVRKQ